MGSAGSACTKPLLPANTSLPNDSGPHTFYTMVENQRHVGIEVWEQAGPEESPDLADNRRVGMGMLKNLPPNLPHLTPIDVTFFMSETGLLTVRAVEQGSGTEVEFDLQIGDLNVAGMNRARQVVAQYHVDVSSVSRHWPPTRSRPTRVSNRQ